jgi:dipeptidyl aminopeptidase/acylaminoacyl peptidase
MLIPRTNLFGNPTRAAARISPDGAMLSWLAPLDGVLNVYVAPFDAPGDAVPVTQDRGRGVRIYGWTYAGGLVYLQDVGGTEDYHVFAVDPLTRETRDLTPFPGVRAGIGLLSRRRRGELPLLLNRRNPRFFDLFSVDLASGALELVEENPGLAGFLTDEAYRAVLALKVAPDGARQVLRKVAGEWSPFLDFAAEDARVSGPNHLDPQGRVLYLRDTRGRDTAALVRLDMLTGENSVLAADPRADIGGMIVDIETFAPRAYSVVVERLEYHALDPAIAPDLAFLQKSAIGDWGLTSRTEDDRLWIVSANSATQPAIDYLYDRSAETLREVLRARPELDGAPLQQMHPVRIPARDGLSLVSYLTKPNVATAPPLVLLVHGGPWARDSYGYNAWHQWLANRGYSVLSVNFRGSTGFGKAFINAGDREWGGKMHDDLIDAVNWSIAEGIADPKRIAICGASYGGYAAFVGATSTPEVFCCSVPVVGVTNLETMLANPPPYWASFYEQECRRIGDPRTPEGVALLKARSPLHRAGDITKPMLIGHGANDVRCKVAESDQIVAAMAERHIPVIYVVYPDEGHGFARPESDIAFKAITEVFLARYLGGRAEPIGDDFTGSSHEIRAGGNVLPELTLPKSPCHQGVTPSSNF